MLQSLLSSLAVFNIGARNVPTDNLSLIVAHRVVASQKPAITSITFAQAQLQLNTSPTRESTIKMALHPFMVIRMKEFTAIRSFPPLFKVKAEVIERDVVGIKAFAVGTENCDNLRREVQHLPELHFTSAQFLLCSFTLSDVDHSAHKFNEMAGRAQNRMTYDVNVPDGAIQMHDAVVRLPLCLLADSRLD